jgi:hypothetical protein
VAIATFVVLGPLALHRYGLVGIASVSLLAQATAYVVSAALARRVFGIRLASRDAGKVLVAGVAMAAALVPFAGVGGVPMTLAALATGGVVYAAAILLLRLDQVRTIRAKFARR